MRARAVSIHRSSQSVLRAALTSVFMILVVIFGVVAWLFVLAQESRRVAQAETRRQTALYEAEIAAHKITDAKLQEAKERAEAANQAKSRYVVGSATNCARRFPPCSAMRNSSKPTRRSRRPGSTAYG